MTESIYPKAVCSLNWEGKRWDEGLSEEVSHGGTKVPEMNDKRKTEKVATGEHGLERMLFVGSGRCLCGRSVMKPQGCEID
jgi:hypothetical protein